MATLYLVDNKLLFCGNCGTPQQDYGGAFAISANCCCGCPECGTLPDLLYGRYTDKTGDAVDLPDTFTLTNPGSTSPGPTQWTGSIGSFGMDCHAAECRLIFTCEDDCIFLVGPDASCGEINGNPGALTPIELISGSPLLWRIEDAEISPLIPSACEGTVTIEISEDPF